MRHHQTGFTLRDLTILLAILMIAGAMTLPNLLKMLQRSKVNHSFAQLARIKYALSLYKNEYGHYPIVPLTRGRRATLSALNYELLPEEYYRGQRQDAWGKAILYSSDERGDEYMLLSAGTDKQQDKLSQWVYTLWWEDYPWASRSQVCQQIPYEHAAAIVAAGCDLILINGKIVGTVPDSPQSQQNGNSY